MTNRHSYKYKEDKKLKRLKNEWTDKSLMTTLLIALLALKKEYGFSEKRAIRFIKAMESVATELGSKSKDIKELKRIVKDKIGIEFKED